MLIGRSLAASGQQPLQNEGDVPEGGALAAGETGANGDLAVFDLAEPPVVHPAHADRAIAFLGKRGVVDDESAVRGAPEQSVGPAGDLIHERTVIPWRGGDGVVNRLIVEVRHMLLHALDVLRPAFGLHQAEQIAADLIRVAIAASVEKPGEILDERHKAAGRSDDVL